MKKLVLVLFLMTVFGTGAFAQRSYSVKDRVDNLKSRLSLTDKQTAQVDSILTAASDSLQNLPSDRQERRGAARKIMTEANNQIMNILNDKQKTEFQKMQEERRNRFRERMNDNNQ